MRQRSRSVSSSLLASAACLATASIASAFPVAIFSNIAGQANNTVPTLGGAFNPGTSSASAFDRPFFSPDGSRWMIGAVKDDATDDKDLIIVGSGTSAVGAQTVVSEDTASFFDGTRTWDAFKVNMGITNTGAYAFGGDVSGATTDDAVVVLWNGATHSVVGREQVTASPVAGQTIGATHDSIHILNDQTIRYRTTLNPTTTKQLLINGAGSLGETDVTSPAGQLVAPAQTVDAFAIDHYSSSADGAHHIWSGDLNGGTTTDAVVVVDGNVVAQEGAPLPGNVVPGVNVGVIPTGDKSPQMSPSGSNWSTRMPLADTTDVVLKNGQVMARTDQPIFAGSLDVWDDTAFGANFFINAVNDNGDMVIGGLIAGDATKDAVLVYHGANGQSSILLSEGDAVDLDGNGQLDDNAFIDIMGNDDAVLTNSGVLYMVVALQNDQNVSIGNAFITLPVPEPTTGLLAAVGAAALGLRRRRK